MNQLMIKIGLSYRGIAKNLKYLKDNGLIKRIGANKNGYWLIKE